MSIERSFLRCRNRLEKMFGRKLNGQGAGKRKIPPRQNKLLLEPLEPRLLLSDLTYNMGAAGVVQDVTLRMQNVSGTDTLQVVDTANPNNVLVSQSAAGTGTVAITGGTESDKLTVDFTNSFLNPVTYTAGNGGNQDTLAIVGGDRTWNITGQNAGTSGNITFGGVENLIGGTNADSFTFGSTGSLNGSINGGAGSDTLDYSARNNAVSVNLLTGTATATGGILNIENVIGGSGNDTLTGDGNANVFTGGPGKDTITGGPGIDTVVETRNADLVLSNTSLTISGEGKDSLSGIEAARLTGGTGDNTLNASTFTGDVVLDGGAGNDVLKGGAGNDVLIGGTGSDTMTGGNGNDRYVLTPGATATINEAANGGTDTLDYSGFTDPVTIDLPDHIATGVATGFSNIENVIGAKNLVISGTTLGDTIIIRDTGTTNDGYMQIEWIEAGGSTYTLTFMAPAESLTVEGHAGADTIDVQGLDSLFSAKLLLYGYEAGAPELMPDPYVDQVTFSGNAFTHGGAVEAFADKIYINDGVTVSTLDSNGEGADIVFRARRISTSELTNFLPLDVYLREAEVDIGANAKLFGGGIYIFAQAEDRDLTTMLGTDRLINNFVIDPLLDMVSGLTAMPVKILYKQSDATITLGQGAQIVGTGTVGLYATAAANATGEANSIYFSAGYGDARATAVVDIASGALIQSTGGAVVVTSDANATAKIKAETEQKEGEGELAGSIAVTNAVATSTVTLASGATVEAYKTANLRAKGDITSEPEAKGSTTENGIAGLAFGIAFSDSDIHTQVDGTIIAHVEGDYLVKLEIDPLETDPTKPGYIDYYKNMINVGNSGLVTEDVINYDSRRGTPIGGLVDDQDYVIIALEDDPTTPNIDESQYIKLAYTEQNAIDGIAVDLKSPSETLTPVTMNTKDFDGSDVDSNRSRIRLDNSAWDMSDNSVDWQLLGLTFELGQAVVYHEGSAPIEGLVDGHTYYIITGIDEFDLQGDSRWVQEQWIQLAETEMEARAGVNISFKLTDPTASVFSLEAKHVLDSGFSNGIGVLSVLKAEDKASAEAGVKPEDNPVFDITDYPPFDSTIFDTIVGALMSNDGASTNAAQAGSNSAGVQGSPVTAAGAFAFSYADHHVTTDVGGTAVLKSNEDLEVKATIEHEVQLSAESETGLPEGQDGTPATGGGDVGVSVAVDLGLFTTDAEATVHSGAQLDALRATRVISMVEHPYLTSPDEFFPSTLGEFIDSIKSEGYEALNKYMDGTLGLKSGLFNSWARSAAEANDVGIAGSVNILSFNDTANSLVESGVLINQDEAWRSWATNPHENNLDPALINPVTGENEDDTSNEQVVSVEASNYMELINMTGIFSLELPEGSLNPPEWKLDPKLDINPVASEGGKGGVGGAIFVMLTNNKTHSAVQDGAKIYSGSDGTFNMKADEAIFNIDLGQAGAKAGTVAVGGTVMYAGQTSETIAKLGSGVEVTGREASIYAASLETNIMWAGGIAKGESIGAGISVAVNDVDRRTLALIGDEENQTPGVAISVPGIKVDEDVTARAIVGGEIWAFTVAGAVVSKGTDQPTANAPGGTDPQAGASTPQLNNQQPAGSPSSPPDANAQQQKQQTGIAIAAAAGVNLIKEYTQASVIDAGLVEAGSLSLTAENRTSVVAVTGGLAFTKESSGDTAVALAGAFSYNGIEATTLALAEDTDFDLDGNGIEWPTDVKNPTEVLPTVRISSIAEGEIIAAAAGGAGSIAGGSSGSGGGSGGGSTAVAVAGSVSVNTITSDNSAMAKNANFTILSTPGDDSKGHVKVTASDTSSVFAISGGLSLSIASGQQGNSTAVSAGIAVAVNKITSSTTATLENVDVEWLNNSKGDLLVSAASAETIDAYTIAGAVSVANGTSGSGVAASGAASGSINQIDFDTRAVVKDSTVTLGTGGATVEAKDASKINSGAGSIAVAVGLGGQGNGGAGAFGAAFSINNIGSAGEGSFVWADIDNSEITSGGDIVVEALNTAQIFSLAIGAAGSVTDSGSGNAIAGSLAGSASINQIRTNTQARARNGSKLETKAGTKKAISVKADDDSSINATAGAAALSISVGQSTAAEVGLGFSLTINDIANTTRAAVEDSDIISNSTVTVSAGSKAEIDSLAFGISVGVAVSGSASAIAANATGALSFNTIDNLIEATVIDTDAAGTASISAGGAVSVTASDDSSIDAIATAATASISGSTSATSVAVGIGLALAHNTIDKDVSASLVKLPSVLTGGNDLTVSARDTSAINATTFAAAVSVALSGSGTSVGIAGGASESTNVILSRTNAYIENSTIGSDGNRVGKVDLDASSTGEIDAIIGAVAAAFSVGNTGVGVAVGVAVARNFIGWDPTGLNVTPDYQSTSRNDEGMDVGTTVGALNPGMKVRIASGALTNDIYEYIGPQVTDSDPNTAGVQTFDLSVQQYRDASLWKQVNVAASPAQVQAYLKNSSVWAVGDLTIDANATESIDAIVVAAAVGVGGGTTTGVAVSAAGSYAENKIKTDIKAYIEGDGTAGINAGSAALKAEDSSGINAIAGAASLAAGFGSTAGVAVAVGLSLGFNEVSNDVEAYIRSADQGITTSSGSIAISALNQGQHLFDLGVGGLITAANLDDAATADMRDDDTANGNEAVTDANGDRDVLEALRAAFTANGETLAMYDTVATAAKFSTSNGTQDVREGDTVRLAKGYANGGLEGRVYRYIVMDDEHDNTKNNINLGTQNYADTSKWQLVDKLKVSTLVEGKSWMLVAPDGKAYVLELNEAGDKISVSRDTINAVSAAASLAVGVGGTAGIAVSGAGAVAQNVILTKTNAYGQNSVLDSADDVTIGAASTSKISSTVVAASLAVGGSATAGVGVSIGVSVARNFIGWTPGATTETPAEVQAYLKNTSVGATGDLSLTSLASQTINSVVIAGSVGVGLSGVVGVAASGAGVSAENKIGIDVKSYIDGDRGGSIAADSVTVTADDTSNIKALAGGVSLAASVAGVAAVSFSIGVSLAHNTITSDVEAYILNADIDAGTGGVTIGATERAAINAVSFAASAGAAFAGIAGVSISGAGADANNVILTGTNAYIKDSAVESDGKVDIDASNTASIKAVVVSASASIAVGGIAGVGVSIGAATAHNFIGYTADAVAQPAEVLAYVQNASVDAKGAVNVTATEDATIDAKIISASASVAGGFIAVAASGAGVSIENKVKTNVKAFVADTLSDGVKAGDTVTIKATDESTITATANAVSFAAAVGLGGAGSVSLSFAKNRIENDVEAYATNAKITTSGTADLVITATEDATITSASTAPSVAAGSFFTVAASGATTDTIIATVTKAYADPVELDIAGDVMIDAISTATGTAESTALAISASIVPIAGGVTEATVDVKPTTEARLGSYETGKAQAGGAISVVATQAGTANATATLGTIAAGLGLSVGETTATATIEPAAGDTPMVKSWISGGNILSNGGETNGGISVKAVYNNDQDGKVVNGSGATATLSAVAVGMIEVSDVDADATSEADVQALVVSSALLKAPGAPINVLAAGKNDATTNLESSGGGLVAVTNSNSTATSNGRYDAGLLGDVRGSDNSPGADTVTVLAQGIDASITQVKSATGGLVNVANDTSNAITGTTHDGIAGAATTATIGRDGSVIVTTGDISVTAIGMTDADSSTSSASGGFVNVANFSGNATATPFVTTTVESNTRLDADGVIRITALHNKLLSDGTFNAGLPAPYPLSDDPLSGVDGDANTITFSVPHGLMTNNVMTFSGNVGGLESGRNYNVIVLNSKTIQLGATFDGTSIDKVTDQIVFANPHNLEDGDTVYYYGPAGQTIGGLTPDTPYEVNKIDDFHIKLLVPGQATPSVTTAASAISADTVTAANDFSIGTPVTYHSTAPVGSFTSICVDAKVDGVKLKTNKDGVETEDNDAIIADWNGDGVLDAHNLATGTALIYTASDPNKAVGTPVSTSHPDGRLISGNTYYAIKYSDGQIRLAESYDNALAGTYLPLTPDTTADGSVVDHTLTRPADAKLPGLVDGQTYFVVNRVTDENGNGISFRLADADGNIMSLNPGGLTGGSHQFVVEGVDLQSPGSGAQKLVLDISAGTGIGQLVRAAGASSGGASTEDLVVTASASGGGGGFIDVKSATAVASTSPTVSLLVGSAAVLEAGEIDITTDALGSAKAVSANDGAGFVSVGDAYATDSVFVTSKISVLSDAVLTAKKSDTIADATGDILISSKSELDGDSVASTKAKGLVGVVDSRARTYIDYETSTTIDGEVNADGALRAEAHTVVDGYTETHADARGLGADSDANDDSDYGVRIGDTKAYNLVDIQGDAVLTGNTVELNAIVDQFKGIAVSTAYAKAAGTDCDAGASVTAKGESEVLLETHANITGSSVLIQSQYLNIDLSANPTAHSDAVGGDTDARATVDVDTTAKVTGRDEAIIRTADLDVDSTQSVTHYDRNPSRDGAWIDSGETPHKGSDKFYRDIFWESRVIMTGKEPDPEVVIDSTGKVTKLVGDVTLTDQIGQNTYGLGHQFAPGDDIVVKDLVNDGSAGNAEFRANTLDDLDAEDGHNDALDHSPDNSPPLGQIWGNNADFEMQNTWDHVYITNNSDRDLFINNIDVMSGKAGTINVKVDRIYGWTDNPADDASLDENHPNKLATGGSATPTFEFQLDNHFDRPEVRIKNLQSSGVGDSDIILDGNIENPIGITQILNERGNILSDSTDADVELIRTNELDLDATTGNIGQQAGTGVTRVPISIELVKFTDTHDVNPPVGLDVYDMILTADAGKDVVLDITANDRSHVGAAAPFDVNIERITAGDDVDLVINDSKAGDDPSPSGGVEVNLYDPPSTTKISSTGGGVTSHHLGDAQSGMYFTHFRPDGTDTAAGNVWRAFGIDYEEVDSAYNFKEVRAGDDIDIGHVTTTGLSGEAEPRSYNLTQITLATKPADPYGPLDVSVVPDPAPTPDKIVNFNINTDVAWTGGSPSAEYDDGLPSTDVHQIFLTTNGDIVASEMAGDMLVGHIHSTGGDVTLSTVNGSILDAISDTVSDVCGKSIDIDANGGSIGTSGDDLEIDSLRGSPVVGLGENGDDVGLEASTGIYLTETDGKLRLVLAHAYGGDIQITVNDSTATGEDLELIKSGTAFTAENDQSQWRTVAHGQIFAEAGSVLLRVGDDLTTHENSEIVAAHNIDIYGDYGNADPGTGTNMLLRGWIGAGVTVTASNPFGTYAESTHTAANLTQIWGNTDADNIWFGNKTGAARGANWGDPSYIFLGSMTIVYGSDNNDVIDARPVTNTGIIIFGGSGEDTIWGSQSDDLIVGDNGRVNFGTTDLTDLDQVWSDEYLTDSGVTSNPYSTAGSGTVYGGNDTISGEGGSDTVIGGVGSDTIYGDNAAGSHGDNDGQDVVIGDNARIFYAGDAYPGSNTRGQFYTLGNTPILGILTTDTGIATGGTDTIDGNAKVDVLIGGVGTDTISRDGTDVVQNDNCFLIFVVDQMMAKSAAPKPSTDQLTDAELAPMVAQAKERWDNALGNDSRANLLEGVHVEITDLPGDILGVTIGNTIFIDTNAAGHGWFIDPTPADDSEFTGGPKPEGMDLLTVVMHEMGHVIGLTDVSVGKNTMDGSFGEGDRLVPKASSVDQYLESLRNEHAQNRIVSLTVDEGLEQAIDLAMEQNPSSWQIDFLLNWGNKHSNPNKDIAVII